MEKRVEVTLSFKVNNYEIGVNSVDLLERLINDWQKHGAVYEPQIHSAEIGGKTREEAREWYRS